jgi:hypothetical protein
MTTTPLIKHFPDLGFTVAAWPQGHYVDFNVYEIVEFQESSTPGTIEPYLHGYVKFDGCSNWYFDQQDRVMLHGCTRADVLRFGEIMAACWDWAAEIIPIWEG